jgi:hypothetical protein
MIHELTFTLKQIKQGEFPLFLFFIPEMNNPF